MAVEGHLHLFKGKSQAVGCVIKSLKNKLRPIFLAICTCKAYFVKVRAYFVNAYFFGNFK